MPHVTIDDEDAFYAARDNRTNLAISQPVEPVPVAIGTDRAWAETVDGQLAFLWLASLIVRMGRRFNRLQLWLPPAVAGMRALFKGMQGASFGDMLLHHLAGVDPFGRFAVVEQGPADAYTVFVGDDHGGAADVVVRPHGWAASLLPGAAEVRHAQTRSGANPIGAALAASLGAAAVYHHFNHDQLPDFSAQPPIWVCAWPPAVAASEDEAGQWPAHPIVGPIDIGRWLVVGAGALGGNALAILGQMPDLRGYIGVADADKVDLTNLNRLVAASVFDIDHLKVEVADCSMRGIDVEVLPYQRRYEQAPDNDSTDLAAGEWNLVLSGVDQWMTRLAIQSDWPRVLIDGGTRGYSWRVSVHPIDSEAACVGCLAANAQATYRDLGGPLACAVGQPGAPGALERPMESHGFVSFLAAAFLAAQALRWAVDPAGRIASSTETTVLNVQGLRHQPRQPSERCLCLCSHPVVRDYRAGKYGGAT